MHSELLLVAACALINKRAEILLTERPLGKDFAGFWEFPGGKCEAGENFESCLIRELQEELFISLSQEQLLEVSFISEKQGTKQLFLALYLCPYDGPVIAREGQRYSFVPLLELDNYNLIPHDRRLLGFLRFAVSQFGHNFCHN